MNREKDGLFDVFTGSKVGLMSWWMVGRGEILGPKEGEMGDGFDGAFGLGLRLGGSDLYTLGEDDCWNIGLEDGTMDGMELIVGDPLGALLLVGRNVAVGVKDGCGEADGSNEREGT